MTTEQTDSAALRFFERTKHPSRIRHANVMDWSNRPYPFKVYEGLDSIPLPEPTALEVPALDALMRGAIETPPPRPPSVQDVTRLLVYGAGVARRRIYGNETFFFRTYASAGALYPVEVYVVCADLPGLSGGAYHFAPQGPHLVKLRDGDQRQYVVRASGMEPSVAGAPLVLIFTGIPWRTSWKYTERGYRHLFWDAGMIVANVLALAGSARFAAKLVLGFADSEIEALLDLDGRDEFPLALLAISSGANVPAASDGANPAHWTTRPLSRKLIEYPLITEVNDAGRLETPEDAAAWRRRGESLGPALHSSAVRVSPAIETGSDSLEKVILRRGSARVFGPGAMPATVLEEILRRATQGVPTDCVPQRSYLIEPFLIVNQGEGLEPGAYVFRDGFQAIRSGDFRREAGLLTLDQRLGSDAAATVFLIARLPHVIRSLGDRGYRTAELSAGIVAGRMYLAAYAHWFGATGLTFFDDLVTRFFLPEAAGRNCLLVMAIGESPRLTRLRRA